MDKHVITISRQWHMPNITTHVTREGISLDISVADFAEAMLQEIGPVTWVFTDKTFRLRFEAAVERVLQSEKDESAKVI